VRTDELIVQLAQSAHPVRPLPPPPARLARWAARSLLVTLVSVLVIGARADALSRLRDLEFAALGAATLLTALLSAFCALVLAIPGAERSPAQRAFPVIASASWVGALIAFLQADGNAASRVLALPVHPLCIIEIAGLAILPGWTLFGMLRGAAPLQPAWTAAFATLAAVAIGAAGTQLLCPIDDAAHHLVGHVIPVALFAGAGAFVFRGSLDWMQRARE
jgi:hypothetical protein